MLIKNGADLNAKDNEHHKMHKMAHQRKIEIEISAWQWCKCPKGDIQGFTALHVAAESNQVEIAELLIEKGADVNAKSEGHLTPLHCSFQNSNLEMSLILMHSGASLIYKDEEGNNVMESSLESNGIEVFKTIVSFQHWCL